MQLVRNHHIGLPIASEPATAPFQKVGTCQFCQRTKMLEGDHCALCTEYIEEQSRSMWVIGWLALAAVTSMVGTACFLVWRFLK